MRLPRLAGAARAADANAALAPVDIVALEFRPGSAADVAAAPPYAHESGGLFLTVRNPGPVSISAEAMVQGMPILEPGDWVEDHPPLYYGKGYWNSFSGEPLAPRATALIWYQGHFQTAGKIPVVARAGKDRLETAVAVLKDPGCYASVPAEDVHTAGWGIGPSWRPGITERRSDACRGDVLLKSVCEERQGRTQLLAREVKCPEGCRDGACRREKASLDGRLLAVVEPLPNAVLKPGEEFAVSFVSRDVARGAFSLECTRQKIGPFPGVAVAEPEQKRKRGARVVMPLGLEANDRCRLVAASDDGRPPISDAVEGLSVPAVKRFEISDVDRPRYDSLGHPRDFAVVIGVEKYAGLPPAEFAERDAAAVRAHVRGLGYPDANVKYLLGSQATRSGMEKVVEEWLPRVVKPDGRVFVYFSGHGAPDVASGRAFLVPWDGDPAYLDSTGYPLARLQEKLAALKARSILVALDSCFSGAGGRSVLPRGARPLVTKVDLGLRRTAVVTLTATGPDQISGTLEARGHGLFTYYLLKGLNEAAMRHERATARSLFAYLEPKVEEEASRQNRAQAPLVFGPADSAVLREP